MVIENDASSDMDAEYLVDVAFYYYGVDDSLNRKHGKEQLCMDVSNDEIRSEEFAIDIQPTITNSRGPMDSAWPMQCYDLHHTSRSPYSTALIDGLEKWRFRVGREVQGGLDGGICIDNHGILYFGDKDCYLFAVYPNGTEKWHYKTEDWITSTPALAEDGTLYVGSWDCYLYAFNSTNGNIKWKLGLGASLSSSPAIGDDGTIYLGDTKGKVWAVNPNGTKKWYYPTGNGNIWGDPALGDSGTIYIGTWGNYFYAINPNGTLKWRFNKGGIMKGSPSIADDGTIYIGSFDGDNNLHALYPNNGTIKWKCGVGYGTETNPSIAVDGTIYVGSYKKLYAIFPNGTKRWSFDIGSDTIISQSSPAISANGTIYVGTQIDSVSGGDIIAINPDGTEKWRKRISNEWIRSSPCIAEDGTVYIGSQCESGGYLHAFGPVESNSSPETPTISGETNGNVGESYWYKLRVVDHDNNPVSFYIDWDDGTTTGWTFERASEENCYYIHKWSEQGDYTIRAKARDVLGEESDWVYLEVKMPVNQQSYSFPLLQRLLERFPNMFPILQNLLKI
jgi:outer membrane protein assembly factor BamB